MNVQSTVALRRPTRAGFMVPFVVLEMADAVERVMGSDNLKVALKEAQLFRLPNATEPVREDKAARLHQSVRKLWPDEAVEIADIAGRAVAQQIMETKIADRAQEMLARMPRATGAWLLAKTARQNAWILSGSGEFVVESEKRFVLRENPLVVGEDAQGMVCQCYANLLEALFSALIHPKLVCREVACAAHGKDACIFEFTMAA